MLYDLVGMATALSFEGGGGGSEPAIVGYKSIYENGIYHASDDEDYYGNPLDGYDELDVWVDSEPVINDITAKENGLYISADYNCDAFGTVTVSVGEDFDFCDKPSIDEITPVIDEEYFVYDKDWGYGMVCEIRENGHRLWVGKVNRTRSYEYQIYSNVTDLVYGNAYLDVVDSSTGQFRIYYTFTYAPGTWRTINRTRSEVIGYGASGHRFTAVKK